MTKRQKVLLVDDTEAFLFVLNFTLKDDYDVVAANNGEEGLKLAKSILPDLIILDVMMPGLSGYEVLEALKSDEATKDIPIVMITGTEGEEDEAKGLALGALDYIRKPFVRSDVKERIDSLMKDAR